ncbi:hypothetical protein PT277_02410 [Acetobacteraceae bacterium ESL0709]|nr:hypothetical protein [Acetobacteraceae bacterium ESL0697]MDF7677555.1 hypothetical protein [Acetobacteraceae bacterium ESL0709]
MLLQDGPGGLMGQAGSCVVAYLRGEKEALVQESLGFLHGMELLWAQHGIAPQQVWEELNERILLSEKLLARGIRARKGGPYRSTKLP